MGFVCLTGVGVLECWSLMSLMSSGVLECWRYRVKSQAPKSRREEMDSRLKAHGNMDNC